MCGTMVNCCKKEGCLYELDKDMDRSVRDHHPVGTGYRILGSDNSCFADRDLDECCILGHATEKTGLSQTGATSLCQERIRQNKKPAVSRFFALVPTVCCGRFFIPGIPDGLELSVPVLHPDIFLQDTLPCSDSYPDNFRSLLGTRPEHLPDTGG